MFRTGAGQEKCVAYLTGLIAAAVDGRKQQLVVDALRALSRLVSGRVNSSTAPPKVKLQFLDYLLFPVMDDQHFFLVVG